MDGLQGKVPLKAMIWGYLYFRGTSRSPRRCLHVPRLHAGAGGCPLRSTAESSRAALGSRGAHGISFLESERQCGVCAIAVFLFEII